MILKPLRGKEYSKSFRDTVTRELGILTDDPTKHLDTASFFPYPFSKRLDLKIDGTVPKYINFRQSDFISILVDSKLKWSSPSCVVTELIFTHEWISNSVEFPLWGQGTVLTNGIHVGYTLGGNVGDEETFNNELFSNQVIQSNSDFMRIFHNITKVSDDKASPNGTVILKGDFHFNRVVEGSGLFLDLSKKDNLWFRIQDNLTAVGNATVELSVRVQGYGWVKR